MDRAFSSARTGAFLVAFAKKNGCRLITCGDPDQHHAVERGDAIRILQDSRAVRSVELTETYRAKVQYLKTCVEDLKAGRIENAYNRLAEHGDVVEEPDLDRLREKAIQTHLDAVRNGHTSILATPLHAEAREATAIVRATLRAEGLIETEEHAVTRLSKLDLEGVERKDRLHYQNGRVVAFYTKVAGGFAPGEKWQVTERQRDGSFKLQRNGEKRDFDPGLKGKWDVYEPSEMLLSVGDQVRVTQGFKEGKTAFANNDIAKVAPIDSEKITLDDGRQMRREFVHLDQGVCITSYASQCRTVRQTVALVPMSTFSQVNEKPFYVLTSRATHRAVFFTDCREAFREEVLREGDRQSVYQYEQAGAKQAPADLQQGAIRAPDFQIDEQTKQEIPMEEIDTGTHSHWPSSFEDELRERVAEKFPDPTPKQQAELERQIQVQVQKHLHRQREEERDREHVTPSMARSIEMEGPGL